MQTRDILSRSATKPVQFAKASEKRPPPRMLRHRPVFRLIVGHSRTSLRPFAHMIAALAHVFAAMAYIVAGSVHMVAASAQMVATLAHAVATLSPMVAT